MLLLTRRVGESIRLGDQTVITVAGAYGDRVELTVLRAGETPPGPDYRYTAGEICHWQPWHQDLPPLRVEYVRLLSTGYHHCRTLHSREDVAVHPSQIRPLPCVGGPL